MGGKLWDLLVSVVQAILRVVSPEIRDYLCNMVRDLKKKAAQTDNPFDDMLVGVLAELLDCKEK